MSKSIKAVLALSLFTAVAACAQQDEPEPIVVEPEPIVAEPVTTKF